MCMHLQMTRLLCVPGEVCKSDDPPSLLCTEASHAW